MKRLFHLLIALIIQGSVSISQVTDTVSIGASYSNQVYYSLSNGIVKDEVKNDWDIAFETGSATGVSIMINAGSGTELFLYPNDTSNWSTLDTAGMLSWVRRYNSDTSWSYGAFSQDPVGFDVGWGVYNQVTHAIVGNRLFVIKLSNGDYQKVWIKDLLSGVFTFRHAAISGSFDQTHTLKKSDYSGKNFGYFSLQTHGAKDKEPLSADWDLFFGQYTTFVPTAYVVTGVLHNMGAEAAKAYPINDPSTYKDFQAHTFSERINTIGWDWKKFNMNTFDYDIADSTVYFVRTAAGDVWKIVFEDFGGSADGNFVFTKDIIRYASVDEFENISFEIYPNPATDRINIIFESTDGYEVQLIDLSGNIVMRERVGNGEWNHTIDLPVLSSGLYVIRLIEGQNSISKKLLIR